MATIETWRQRFNEVRLHSTRRRHGRGFLRNRSDRVSFRAPASFSWSCGRTWDAGGRWFKSGRPGIHDGPDVPREPGWCQGLLQGALSAPERWVVLPTRWRPSSATSPCMSRRCCTASTRRCSCRRTGSSSPSGV